MHFKEVRYFSSVFAAEFRRKHLTLEQAADLIDKANELKDNSIIDLRNCVLVNLLLFTGMRTIEASRADRNDIYKSTINEKTYLSIQGKGRDEKDESVLISDYLLGLINEYLEKRNDKFEPLFIEHSKNRNGGRLTTSTISKAIKKLLKLIGINQKEITAHSLRHTFATAAKELGISLEELQARLRHKSGDTTQRYNHYDERENSVVELKVEEAIRNHVKK
ncbi:MAG: tyrosine-type recombinase/integrase [Bacilli bacterium]|nr:tyrosine-type recombinase/integrase [Bacilli bacterium]